MSSPPIKRPLKWNLLQMESWPASQPKLDDVIPVTEVIAYILAPGEALPAKTAPKPVAAVSTQSTAKVEATVETAAVAVCILRGEQSTSHPVARRMAEELGMDLTQIPGRGPRGRIHKADMLAFQKPIEQPNIPTPSISASHCDFRHLPACLARYHCRMRARSRSCRWLGRARSSPSAWHTAYSPLRTLTCLCGWT